jgi:hypothetical protein
MSVLPGPINEKMNNSQQHYVAKYWDRFSSNAEKNVVIKNKEFVFGLY